MAPDGVSKRQMAASRLKLSGSDQPALARAADGGFQKCMRLDIHNGIYVSDYEGTTGHIAAMPLGPRLQQLLTTYVLHL